jgi:DNA processing protein
MKNLDAYELQEDILKKDLEWLETNHCKTLEISSEDYPPLLKLIPDPPEKLYVWGNASVLSQNLISMVGSREPAHESIEWMETYIPELIKLGINIVSGGARGIDQRAHSLALRNKAPTIVVLPSGFQNLYPKELGYWKDIIFANGGCFVSELLPSARMRTHYFHQRNRIVVGLSKTLLLVEARRRSGSSMSARLAVEQGRCVAVVPGSPVKQNWGASLDLISQGAFCVRDAVDVWLLHSNSTLGEGEREPVP